jgi:hypothetical protein
MSNFQFRNLTQATADEWFRKQGFVPDGNGGWHKPKRGVPVVREEASPELKPLVRHAHVQPAQREAIYPGRCAVRVTSYVCGQLRDTDNICPKYFIDSLRYAGLIRDDCPGSIHLEVKEERVSTKKEEGCLIEIIPFL